MAVRIKRFLSLRRAEKFEVPSLKDLVFQRICKDIGRHSVQYHIAEDITEYLILQRDEADKILETMLKIDSTVQDGRHNSIFHRILGTWSPLYIQLFYNFVFNRYLTRIELNAEYLDQDIALAIIRNCKDLVRLTIRNAILVPELCVLLFSSLRQLTVLCLKNCQQLTLETLQVISGSLTNLKSLDLSYSNISNYGIYILCGHKPPFRQASPINCCYIKNCGVSSSLKLQHINISDISDSCVTEAAIACLLTHVPTLRRIALTDANNQFLSYRYASMRVTSQLLQRYDSQVFTLESLVCIINLLRENRGMPIVTFRLEYLDTSLCDSTSMRTLLSYFPNVKELSAHIRPWHSVDQHLGGALAEQELNCLQSIQLQFTSTTDIFTDEFKKFWELKGHQLTRLILRCHDFQGVFYCSHLVGILKMCPNLLCLSVYCVKLPEAETIEETIEDYPVLPKLKEIQCHIHVESSTVSNMCYNIIRSSKNISIVHLRIPFRMEAFFENLLTKENFPCLRELSFLMTDAPE